MSDTAAKALTFNLKDFLYIVVLVASVSVAFATVRGDATRALTKAEENARQIQVNSAITSGYDVIILRLDTIDSRLTSIESEVKAMEDDR